MIGWQEIEEFASESNNIEGIYSAERAWKHAEELQHFLEIQIITVSDVIEFVQAIQPGAKLRNQPGMNVMVGNHVPPGGGPLITSMLVDILEDVRGGKDKSKIRHWSWHPYHLHHRYETLHPFTDGNGRSGRAIWLWQMVKQYGYDGGRLFLHEWYYQSLQSGRK